MSPAVRLFGEAWDRPPPRVAATGVAVFGRCRPSKFLAKLASVAAKPRATPAGVQDGKGVVEVKPGEELAFLHPLPVTALWGVGPATLERLERLGVRTVSDLAELDERTLVTAVGKAHGEHLHRLSWALDDRPVEVDRGLKSIGQGDLPPISTRARNCNASWCVWRTRWRPACAPMARGRARWR
jgi:nucleotidyltransferase/DNA polymerase involved in DNA repair